MVKHGSNKNSVFICAPPWEIFQENLYQKKTQRSEERKGDLYKLCDLRFSTVKKNR